MRAVAPAKRCSTVPYVTPGGEILLRLSGWQKVERVLQMTDAIEALGIDPAIQLMPRLIIGTRLSRLQLAMPAKTFIAKNRSP